MTTTAEQIDGNDLAGMGARYWYATFSKLAQSAVKRYLAGEADDTLRPAMEHLAVLAEQGPWRSLDADAKAAIALLLPTAAPRADDVDAAAWRPVPPPSPNRDDGLLEALFAVRPDLAPYPARFTAESWANVLVLTEHARHAIAVNGTTAPSGKPWPIVRVLREFEKLLATYNDVLGLTVRTRATVEV